MYLIDTNVWVELLLEQQRAKEVKKFFQEIEASVKDLKEIYHICKQFNLDFDDSYQYLSALKHGYINNHYNVQTFQRANVQT